MNEPAAREVVLAVTVSHDFGARGWTACFKPAAMLEIVARFVTSAAGW